MRGQRTGLTGPARHPRCTAQQALADELPDIRDYLNTRDASRMLMPSTITARRTRRYTSTWYIRRTIHRLNFKPMDDGRQYSIQSPIVSNSSAHVDHFDSADYIFTQREMTIHNINVLRTACLKREELIAFREGDQDALEGVWTRLKEAVRRMEESREAVRQSSLVTAITQA